MIRRYEVIISVDSESIAQTIDDIKARVEPISVKCLEQTRTGQQNSALHLFFTQLADALNDKHMDMRAVIRPDVEIEWTGYSVKENLWRPLQKMLYGKKSTTELFKTQEIDKIYDYIVKIVAERTKGEVQVPTFPSWESQLNNENDLTNTKTL